MRRALIRVGREELVEKLEHRKGALISKAQGTHQRKQRQTAVSEEVAHRLPKNNDIEHYAWN